LAPARRDRRRREQREEKMATHGEVLTVTPRSPIVGADIGGVDLSADLSDDVIAAIRAALLTHGVIFFRDQDLSPAQQVALSKRFGEVLPHPVKGIFPEVEGGLIIMDQAPDASFRIEGKTVAGHQWHMDNLFAEKPPMGTILYAVQTPDSGGDTCFASLGAVYDSFSPGFRAFLDTLTALNSTTAFYTRKLETAVAQSSIHPVVRVHPETGRKMVNVSPNWTEKICELDPVESRAVLELIYQRIAMSPDFQCRFSWRTGSVAFWDNRAVHHYAVGDYMSRRTMHRVMLAGDRPVGVGAASSPASLQRALG
jgi:taurine dioxygenase